MSGLNLAQHEAVNYLHGPCLVLAGAGSGKTRVITHKIAHLIAGRATTPAQIAAITFTNKAAAGDARARQGAGRAARRKARWSICTFHALGVRILRSDGARARPEAAVLASSTATTCSAS